MQPDQQNTNPGLTSNPAQPATPQFTNPSPATPEPNAVSQPSFAAPETTVPLQTVEQTAAPQAPQSVQPEASPALSPSPAAHFSQPEVAAPLQQPTPATVDTPAAAQPAVVTPSAPAETVQPAAVAASTAAASTATDQPAQPTVYESAEASSTPAAEAGAKDFKTTWILAVLLGSLGIDRFYVGKIGTGILKLITSGGFGIWSLVDVIFILTGKTRTKSGADLANRPASVKNYVIMTVLFYVIIAPVVTGLAMLVLATSIHGLQQKSNMVDQTSSTSTSSDFVSAPDPVSNQ